MRKLKRLPTQNGYIKIVKKSANSYKDIGTKLLSAELVKSISEVANPDPRKATTLKAISRKAICLIYRKWIRTDKDHSWHNLAQCFRDVGLHPLAEDIKQHFPSPSSESLYS